MEVPLDLLSYARLAGAIFAVVAILQLVRALAGWPVTIGRTDVPVWVSWTAVLIAGALAWIGLTAHLA